MSRIMASPVTPLALAGLAAVLAGIAIWMELS
jgi:hypothetical protein